MVAPSFKILYVEVHGEQTKNISELSDHRYISRLYSIDLAKSTISENNDYVFSCVFRNYHTSVLSLIPFHVHKPPNSPAAHPLLKIQSCDAVILKVRNFSHKPACSFSYMAIFG